MAEQAVEKQTFFSTFDPKFPQVAEGKPIETSAFLQAAKNVPAFFDSMGTAFKLIKNDISGNITKLEKKYQENPQEFATFKAMLDAEVKEGKTRDSKSATIALLWLKRALQFMVNFMDAIVKDEKEVENLVPFVTDAYATILKPFHGLLARGAFSLCSKATPYRKDLLKALAKKQDGMDKEVIKGMAEFVTSLNANLEQIQAMYTEMGLDFPDKA